MKSFINIAASLITLVFLLTYWQDQGWRGIIPLQSTRTDVEKILGQPVRKSDSIYETDKEVVSIIYSDGPCKEGRAGSWNVSTDTVIRIEVTPKKPLRISDLHLGESKYKKIAHPHISGMFSYVDEEDGVTINTRYENVEEIFYGPTAKDKHFNCSNEHS